MAAYGRQFLNRNASATTRDRKASVVWRACCIRYRRPRRMPIHGFVGNRGRRYTYILYLYTFCTNIVVLMNVNYYRVPHEPFSPAACRIPLARAPIYGLGLGVGPRRVGTCSSVWFDVFFTVEPADVVSTERDCRYSR